MKTDLQKHLFGVYSVLRARIELINASIGHNLTQGEETERDIVSLLSDFLPSNYGISSGIIIDTEGNATKQVDIIIYDKLRADYTLSSSSKIFFADHVIAAIEVKTTYTTGEKSSLSTALENIASVKRLKVAKRNWIESRFNPDKNQLEYVEFQPAPPLGIIFFFKANDTQTSIDLDQHINGLKEAVDKVPLELQPEFIFSLDHCSFFRHTDISQKTANTQNYAICLVQMGSENVKLVSLSGLTNQTKALIDFSQLEFSEGITIESVELKNSRSTSQLNLVAGEELKLDPVVYRTAIAQGKHYLLDKFRAFLIFVYTMEKLLGIKRTNKAWSIVDYFGPTFTLSADYFKDL